MIHTYYYKKASCSGNIDTEMALWLKDFKNLKASEEPELTDIQKGFSDMKTGADKLSLPEHLQGQIGFLKRALPMLIKHTDIFCTDLRQRDRLKMHLRTQLKKVLTVEKNIQTATSKKKPLDRSKLQLDQIHRRLIQLPALETYRPIFQEVHGHINNAFQHGLYHMATEKLITALLPTTTVATGQSRELRTVNPQAAESLNREIAKKSEQDPEGHKAHLERATTYLRLLGQVSSISALEANITDALHSYKDISLAIDTARRDKTQGAMRLLHIKRAVDEQLSIMARSESDEGPVFPKLITLLKSPEDLEDDIETLRRTLGEYRQTLNGKLSLSVRLLDSVVKAPTHGRIDEQFLAIMTQQMKNRGLDRPGRETALPLVAIQAGTASAQLLTDLGRGGSIGRLPHMVAGKVFTSILQSTLGTLDEKLTQFPATAPTLLMKLQNAQDMLMSTLYMASNILLHTRSEEAAEDQGACAIDQEAPSWLEEWAEDLKRGREELTTAFLVASLCVITIQSIQGIVSLIPQGNRELSPLRHTLIGIGKMAANILLPLCMLGLMEHLSQESQA